MARAWRDVLVGCSVEQLALLDDLLTRMREVTGIEIARLRLRGNDGEQRATRTSRRPGRG